jgi:hypothetical protein
MNPLVKTVLIAIIFVTVISCKKDVKTNFNQEQIQASVNSSDATNSCVSQWQGVYGTIDEPYSFVEDKTFINNGVASLTNSPWSYFYTSILLSIPRCHRMSGDSARLTVRLKNPSDEAGSVAPYDVSLWLKGLKDTGYVQFLAQYPEYTALKVGDLGITNSTDLIHLFQDWTELTLEAKNKRLSVYLNGVLVKQIIYKGRKIGALKEISVSFKGSGIIDWVRLHNSNSGVQLMQEDFNVNGHSSVIWY